MRKRVILHSKHNVLTILVLILKRELYIYIYADRQCDSYQRKLKLKCSSMKMILKTKNEKDFYN